MQNVNKTCWIVVIAVLVLGSINPHAQSQTPVVYTPTYGNRLVGELYPYDTLESSPRTVKLPSNLRQDWQTLIAISAPQSGIVRLAADPEHRQFWSVFEMRANDVPNPKINFSQSLTLAIAGLKDYKVSDRLVLLLDATGRELGRLATTGDLAYVYVGNLSGEGYLELLTVEVTGDATGFARVWRFKPNQGWIPIYKTPQNEPLFIWRDGIRLTYSNLDNRPLIASNLPSVKIVLLKQLIPGLLYYEVYHYSASQQNYVNRSGYYPRIIAPQYRYYTKLLEELQTGFITSAGAKLFLNDSGEIDEVKYSKLVEIVRSWQNSANIEVLTRIADNY